MAVNSFLSRALMDPDTGLPNSPYFSIIRDWEERRARRRGYSVRVVVVHATTDDEALLRSLGWRLCQELRTSDLIASEGKNVFRILLTTPDAENAELIQSRIEQLGRALNVDQPRARLQFRVEIQPVTKSQERGPCEPCDDGIFDSDG